MTGGVGPTPHADPLRDQTHGQMLHCRDWPRVGAAVPSDEWVQTDYRSLLTKVGVTTTEWAEPRGRSNIKIA